MDVMFACFVGYSEKRTQIDFIVLLGEQIPGRGFQF